MSSIVVVASQSCSAGVVCETPEIDAGADAAALHGGAVADGARMTKAGVRAAAAGSKESGTRDGWLAVAAVALGAFVIVTTEFLPVGFLPRIAASLHVSLGLAGLMVLVPGLSAAVAAPLLFVGAGRVNRRTIILALGLLVLASNGIASIAPDFTVVVAARVLLGIAIAGFWTVVTPVGPKLVGPARGTRAISIIVAGVSAGTVAGLPAGQFLGNLLGWRGTFAATAAAALVIVAVQAAALPSIAPDGHAKARDLAGVVARPFARLGLIASAVVFIGQFAASTYITPFLLDQAHLHGGLVSGVFVGYGCGGILGALIGGRLVARSLAGSFAGSAIAVAALLLGLSFSASTVWLACILVIAWGLAWGIMPLTAQVWQLRAVPGAQEAASAVNVTNLQLSIAAGSALGGILVDSASLQTVYITAASVTLAAGLLAAAFGHMRPKP